MLRLGSLFTGYGGLDMAAETVLGARAVWVADNAPGPQKILGHRFPGIPNHGDITRVDWSQVEPVDIITGGSPCQDVSHAGKRAGMTAGTRSNLWVTMRDAIATIKPTYVAWENVRGAYSAEADSDLEHCPGCMGDPGDRGPALRALGRVLGDLSDLGYHTVWHGLRASDVGACHGRFRVFVLAWRRDTATHADHIGAHGTGAHVSRGAESANGDRPPVALLPTPAASQFNDGEGPESWLARRERVKLTANNGNGMGMPLSVAIALLPTPTTTQRGTDANLDTREGARANLHNEVVNLLPTPRADEGGGNGEAEAMRHSPGLSNIRTHFPEVARWGDYAPAIARWETRTRPAPAPTETGAKGNPRLSPRFVEWMMGLPAGWVTDVPGITRTEALTALGNGVVPQQAIAALTRCLAIRAKHAGAAT